MPLKCLTGCPDPAILITSKRGELNNPTLRYVNTVQPPSFVMSICKTKEWTTLACEVFLFNVQNRMITIDISWVHVELEVPTEEFNNMDFSNWVTKGNWITSKLPERTILDAICEVTLLDDYLDGETLENLGFTFNYVITDFKEVGTLGLPVRFTS